MHGLATIHSLQQLRYPVPQSSTFTTTHRAALGKRCLAQAAQRISGVNIKRNVFCGRLNYFILFLK